jgi:uncharacterized circularly permuted ATP-grasp superfamily protein/uncharacterized alpha-E superfamily protein
MTLDIGSTSRSAYANASRTCAPVSVTGSYDEAALPSGALRPHWHTLMGELDALGPKELGRRRERGQLLLEDNGVTYNVYGDPRGMDRPWQLDRVPLLLSEREWRGIEAAVVQRARLFSAIFSDLYGPQQLLKEAWLPAELVYGNPGFFRPCHGITTAGNPLFVYSADLARSADGQWWVLSDRAQAPSGAGYALENRVVLSRTLPELFRALHVERLAGYFQTFRESLMALGAERSENPQVVLLTPGPFNETYFEHAYLARYLGFPLVEGADLTVRDERVYLKTLSGLRPVDVILRRQDDHFCDPLELYRDSALGVAGLVQAVRAGNVSVANALGSGVLETAAFMAFLPGLSRRLLAEEPLMPSVATWWCGQDKERAHVVENIENLVVKPALPGPRRDVVFGDQLDARGRERLRREIYDRPSQYVAQERVQLSTAPTDVDGLLQPRHVVLRVFAVADGDGYAVLPGGLTRVSTTPDSLVVSSQAGGGSKDTFVLSDRPVPYVSGLQRVEQPIEVDRGAEVVTSRVADNLFWLGRMSERLEAGLRLFRTGLRDLSDRSDDLSDESLPEMVLLIRRVGRLAPALTAEEQNEDVRSGMSVVEERVLRSLFDARVPGGLRQDAQRLHRLAWLVRDRISLDAWRILSRLDQEFEAPEGTPILRLSEGLRLLDEMLITLSAFIGLVMDSTTRGLGWRFLEIGRRLERGLQIAALVRYGLTDALPEGSRQLQKLLEIADCSITYRSRYLTSIQLPLVVDLLLLDESNPRSLAFQIRQTADHLRTLRKVPPDGMFELAQRLRGVNVDTLVDLQPDAWGPARRGRLEALLAEVMGVLLDLSDALNHAYLSHALPVRQPEPIMGVAR